MLHFLAKQSAKSFKTEALLTARLTSERDIYCVGWHDPPTLRLDHLREKGHLSDSDSRPVLCSAVLCAGRLNFPTSMHAPPLGPVANKNLSKNLLAPEERGGLKSKFVCKKKFLPDKFLLDKKSHSESE